jgi:hypothetical protein
MDSDDEFIRNYYAQYGESTDYNSVPTPQPVDAKPTKEEKRAMKREAEQAKAQRLAGWVQMSEEQNTKVYISGLPKTITEKEYIVGLVWG